MKTRKLTLTLLLMATASSLSAQERIITDSAHAEILPVLRAFYLNYASQNWDALAAYVLSPKLLERRGTPKDLELVRRDRTRARAAGPEVALPRECPSGASPMLADAVIRVDGDWADVSVPRCDGLSPGVDQFGMLYFEERWRFIYTDLFKAPPPTETAAQ